MRSKKNFLSLKQLRKIRRNAKKNKCQLSEESGNFDTIAYRVSESPLEKLPVELINALIELAPEAVSGLRLASRVLQSRVYKYARSPSNMMLVDQVFFGSNFVEFLSFIVPSHKCDLFEMRLRLQLPKLSTIICRGRTSGDTTFAIVMDTFIANNTLKALGSVIGRNIGALIIARMPESVTCKRMLFRFLEGVKFTRLQSSIHVLAKHICEFLFDIIKLHKIESISIEVLAIEAENPDEIHSTLFEFSTLAKSMKIHQLTVNCASPLSTYKNYLFGLVNGNWSWIISEMFSRKLDKLEIVNDHSNYLTSEDGYLLRNKLRFIDKNLWFTTTFYIRSLHWDELYPDGRLYHQFKLNNYVVRGLPFRFVTLLKDSRIGDLFK